MVLCHVYSSIFFISIFETHLDTQIVQRVHPCMQPCMHVVKASLYWKWHLLIHVMLSIL